MTKVIDFAKERRFLDRVAADLRSCRVCAAYDGIKEAVEDLEMIVKHTEHVQLRSRAQKLIDTAFDPLRD